MQPVSTCLDTVLAAASRVRRRTKRVAVFPPHAALNLVSAADVIASCPYPPFVSSIVDGYALGREEDAKSSCIGVSTTTPAIYAGASDGTDNSVSNNDDDLLSKRTGPLHAIYVTTGACVPNNYTCVVPIESCAVSNDELSISVDAHYKFPANRNVRPVGCDISVGAKVLRAGQVLNSSTLGILATAGVPEVAVYERPVVGVLSSGDEVADPSLAGSGTRLPHGVVFDANRPTLLASLLEFDATPVDLGIVKDDMNLLASALSSALERCDVVITTGGVSMGAKDHVPGALRSLGVDLKFDRMFMKPGKPTTFGVAADGKLVFALPGNPVSAKVVSELLVKPALRLMSGLGPSPLKVRARLSTSIRLDEVRPEYHRAVVTYDPGTGGYEAASTGVQRSSRLMSMVSPGGVAANGLVMLPSGGDAGRGEVGKGEEFDVLMIGEVLAARRRGRGGCVLVAVGPEGMKLPEGLLETAKLTFSSVAVVDACGVEGIPSALRAAEAKREDSTGFVLVLNSKRFDSSVAEAVRSTLEKIAPSLEMQAITLGCSVLGPAFSFSEVAAGSTGTGTLVVSALADPTFGAESWRPFFEWLAEINRAFVQKRF